MYKCEICGSRTCPACLDCKDLGNRKTGFYCNRYKVRLTALNQTNPHYSIIEQLHDGARACAQCILDRTRLPIESTSTLEVAAESDEEPFVLEEQDHPNHVPLPAFEGTPVGVTPRPPTATAYTTTTTANNRMTAADVRRAIDALHTREIDPYVTPAQRRTNPSIMDTLAAQNDGTTMQSLEERVFLDHLMQHIAANEARLANARTTDTTATPYNTAYGTTASYTANPSTITAAGRSVAPPWYGNRELEN